MASTVISFVLLLSIFIAFSRTTAGCSVKKVVSYRSAEIVLVLALSDEVSDSEYEQMISMIRQLPDSLQMGMSNGECQMAVVIIGSSGAETKVDMTAMEYKIRHFEHRRPTPPLFPSVSNEGIPVYSGKATRIAVLFTDGKPVYGGKYAMSPSPDVVYYASYVGYPSIETVNYLKVITGDFSRVFDSKDFSQLVIALNKSLEMVEYECDTESVPDYHGVQLEPTDSTCNTTCPEVVECECDGQVEAVGCDPTRIEVFSCSFSGALQPPEQIDCHPPASIGIGMVMSFVGGTVAMLVLEGIVFIIWKRRAAGKNIGQRQRDSQRSDAVQNRAYYQKTGRIDDDKGALFVDPSSMNVYVDIEDVKDDLKKSGAITLL